MPKDSQIKDSQINNSDAQDSDTEDSETVASDSVASDTEGSETVASMPATSEAADTHDVPGITDLTYEQARDQLVSIVAQLEGGQIGLEDSMMLWQRGEALATHCSRWLDGAEARLTSGARSAEGQS